MKYQNTCIMFKVKNNLKQGCPIKHVACLVLDTPDLQDYSRHSNFLKTPNIKFRTFEHFLKFLQDAKFNPKFRSCPKFQIFRTVWQPCYRSFGAAAFPKDQGKRKKHVFVFLY